MEEQTSPAVSDVEDRLANAEHPGQQCHEVQSQEEVRQSQCCLRCLDPSLPLHECKERRSSIQTCLLQTALSILQIPCVLYDGICRVLHAVRERVGRYSKVGSAGAQSVLTDGFNIKSEDVASAQASEYRGDISHVQNTCHLSHTAPIWQSVVNELSVTSDKGLVVKLQCWLDSFGPDASEDTQQLFTDLLAKAISKDQELIVLALLKHLPTWNVRLVSGGQYTGMTPFHVAIVTHSESLIKIMISMCEGKTDKLEELLHKPAKTDRWSKTMKTLLPWAELPLHLAVWMGDTEVVRTLVDNGVEMTAQDGNGNNVLHCVTLLAEVNKTLALTMFKCLLALLPAWTSKSRACVFLKSLSPASRLKQGKQLLFLTENSAGYTPLKLAAQLGLPMFVENILNVDDVYRFDHVQCGLNSFAWYDISEVDPGLDPHTRSKTPKVLEIVSVQFKVDTLHFLEVPVLKHTLKSKERIYWPYIATWSLIHLVYISTYSILVAEQIFPRLQTKDQNITDSSDDLNKTTSKNLRFTLHWLDYMQLSYATLLFLYSTLFLWHIISFGRRNHVELKRYRSLFHILNLGYFWSFSHASIWYFILKALECEAEIFFLSYVLFMGWFCCFLPTRLFTSTAHFTLMLEYLLVQEIVYFLLAIILLVFAFTYSALTLLAVDDELGEELLFPLQSAFTLFQFACGVVSLDWTAEGSSYSRLISLNYYLFVCLVNILLINLLIAAMNYTYSKFSQVTQLLYQKLQLFDFLILGSVLPPGLQRRDESCKRLTVTCFGTGGEKKQRELHLIAVEARISPQAQC